MPLFEQALLPLHVINTFCALFDCDTKVFLQALFPLQLTTVLSVSTTIVPGQALLLAQSIVVTVNEITF